MILGTCPYPNCDQFMANPIADLPLPQYERLRCEHCGRVVWLKHSRIDPEAWTDEDFREAHDVDDETKAVTPKEPSP